MIPILFFLDKSTSVNQLFTEVKVVSPGQDLI